MKRGSAPKWKGNRDMLGKKVTMVVDRPIGSVHPSYPETRYQVNYGYVPGVKAADGEDQDAYLLGIDVPMAVFTGTVIAVIHRLDDVEDKWVVAPAGMTFAKKEIEALVYFQEQYFAHEIEMEQAGRTIETRRLVLKPAQIDFAGQCADFYRRNARFLAEFEPERDAGFCEKENQQMILLEEIVDIKEKKAAPFYIFTKENEAYLIGKISLSNMIWGGFCSCLIGYKMDREFINRGYMTEAVSAVVEYGFEVLGLHRIEANVMPGNVRSLRVLEKCGFVEEGLSRRYLQVNGVWEDHLHMAVLNDAME